MSDKIEDRGRVLEDAFRWLILIMSTMNGVLISIPETLVMKKATAGAVLLPFFELVIIWLVGNLIKGEQRKAILKTFAWFYALILFWLLGQIFSDQILGTMKTLNSIFVRYPLLVFPFMAFMYGGPFLFFDQLLRPSYREVYKESTVLSSRRKLALLYILASVTIIVQILPFLFLGVFQ